MKKILLILLISSFCATFALAKTKKIKAEAYRQSTKLLKMATSELVEAIMTADFPMWKDFPERKKILLNILPYENLAKLPGTDNVFKGGEILSIDHEINPHILLIYKPFYQTYAGTADSEFDDKLAHIKKMLLMEASLTWGFSDIEAEKFATDFLTFIKPVASAKPISECDNPKGPFVGCGPHPEILPTLPTVELTNFIDPFSGNYTTKLTLPKNFAGTLYLSGLNISSLNPNQVKVRFRFGKDLQPIDIETTIGRAQGIIPSTDKEVLQLDMNSIPFKNLRLLYDLYDYTDYRNAEGIEEFVDEYGNIVGPLYNDEGMFNDSRDYNLYCRGLNLQDDPTFEATADNRLCDEKGEKCLYTYAKIVDKALITNDDDQLAITPRTPQVDTSSLAYTQQTVSEDFKKCFPDNNDTANLKGILNAESVGNNSKTLTYNDLVTMKDGTNLLYQGPFRTIGYNPVDRTNNKWNIIGDALIYPSDVNTQAFGLFQVSYIKDDPNSGFISMMYPRAGKIALRANTEYWGSEEPLGVRTLQKMKTGGKSLFVDGSNIRMKNFNSFINEGISSCNLTATIELITNDPITGKEISLLKTPNRELKLQVIRASLKQITGGEEVLYSSLQTCSNNNGCGNNECCFGNRCWDRRLVSSCMEPNNNEGNRATGEICKTDYDCASLCCDKSTGVCGVHINTEQETYLCGKAPGQTCVTKEFCRKENISECKIIKTGTDANGKVTCYLKCYNSPTFGDCRNGYCTAPTQRPVPSFDPNNPDCTNAEDPPLTVN